MGRPTLTEEQRRASLDARFRRYAVPGGAEGCWEWIGARLVSGYGAIGTGARCATTALAHRLALERANGPIPAGLRVCHHCDNPPCFRTVPDSKYPNGHLFLGTDKDNSDDKIRKGRYRQAGVSGAEHHAAKLTEADIPIVRDRSNTIRSLMSRFGICKATIDHIRARRLWKHVP